jgi:hypothetical protein
LLRRALLLRVGELAAAEVHAATEAWWIPTLENRRWQPGAGYFALVAHAVGVIAPIMELGPYGLSGLTPTCRRQNETDSTEGTACRVSDDGIAQSLARLDCGSVR